VRVMVSAAPRTLIGRLRQSTRIAGLLLLVFALKISAASACATHDLAEVGIFNAAGTANSEMAMETPAGGSGDGLTEMGLGHSTCTHGGCHHSAALAPHTYVSLSDSTKGIAVRTSSLRPSASPQRELRPPIV